VSAISRIREILTRNYFPTTIDLRIQTHIAVWSDHYFITKSLFELLPFGRTLPPTTFYQYIDYQLPNLVEQASNNLLYWSISGTQHFTGEPASQLTLFHDDTFLWHYYVPAKYQEITQSLYNGHRIRFLSRFHLSETQIEVEFNEIRLLENPGERPQLVYTDSKEYTYKWTTEQWDITIVNHDTAIINPQIYTLPISAPNTLGRDAEYQDQLDKFLEQTDDFSVSAQYWNSVESTETESRTSSPLPTFFFSPPSPPALAVCQCGIDLCRCNYRPNTPPTPPYIELWKPSQDLLPRRGIHYQRHNSSTESGFEI
jgi:hypothetical protein